MNLNHRLRFNRGTEVGGGERTFFLSTKIKAETQSFSLLYTFARQILSRLLSHWKWGLLGDLFHSLYADTLLPCCISVPHPHPRRQRISGVLRLKACLSEHLPAHCGFWLLLHLLPLRIYLNFLPSQLFILSNIL